MDDPVKEIQDVVRGIVQPYEASVIANNIDKYFTDDCIFQHPYLKQPERFRGKKYYKSLYKMMRVTAISKGIDFYSVMFSEDKTEVALDATAYIEGNHIPKFFLTQHLEYVVRLGLRKEEDGKYRICRQNDHMVRETALTGLFSVPFSSPILEFIRSMLGFWICIVGNFLLERGLLGP